jgi:uncharacterized protein involved in exopolysaccharide biosynthesis
MMPPTQTSTSLPASIISAKLGSDAAGLAGDVLGMKNQGSLDAAMLRSRNVQEKLVRRFGLQQLYRDRYLSDALKDLDSYTGVDEDRKSGIITVTVTDRDPVRASKIANAYIEELNRVSVQLDIGAAHREREFLEQRLGEVTRDLDDVSRQLARFSSKNMTIDIAEQGKASVEAAATLEGKVIAAESELRGLEQIYGEDNSRVRSTQASLTELRRQLNRVTVSDNAVDQLHPSIRDLPLVGIGYAELYRRVKIQSVIFEVLTQQYEMAKVAEAKELPVVRVLDAGNIPDRRSSPKRGLIVAASLVISPTFGILCIIMLGYWNTLDPSHGGKQLARALSEHVRRTWPARVLRAPSRRS